MGVRAILFLMLCKFEKKVLLLRGGGETEAIVLKVVVSKRLTVGLLVCNLFTSEILPRRLCKPLVSGIGTAWLTSTWC